MMEALAEIQSKGDHMIGAIRGQRQVRCWMMEEDVTLSSSFSTG